MIKKELSFFQKFSWDFIGSIIYSLSQWFVLIVLAKFGTVSMVGLYALGLAVTAPIVLMSNLQLRGIIATDVENKYSFDLYFTLRNITNILTILVILVFSNLANYNQNEFFVIVLIGISKIIDSYSDLIYGKMQQNGRMDLIGLSRSIKGLLTIFSMTLGLILTNSLVISLVILNIVWLLILMFFDYIKLQYLVPNLKLELKYNRLKKLFFLSFPLGIVLMFGSLNVSLPRIFLEKNTDTETLGYFASISFLVISGSMVINSVGQALAPTLANLFYASKIDEYKKLLGKMLFFSLFIGIFGLLITFFMGKFILTLVYNNEYARYSEILVLCMIAGIFEFLSSVLGYSLTAMRIFNVQAYLSSFNVLVCLISVSVLIPLFGIKGAAFSLIISSSIQFFILATYTKMKLKM